MEGDRGRRPACEGLGGGSVGWCQARDDAPFFFFFFFFFFLLLFASDGIFGAVASSVPFPRPLDGTGAMCFSLSGYSLTRALSTARVPGCDPYRPVEPTEAVDSASFFCSFHAFDFYFSVLFLQGVFLQVRLLGSSRSSVLTGSSLQPSRGLERRAG